MLVKIHPVLSISLSFSFLRFSRRLVRWMTMVQSKGGGVAGAFSREIKASVAPSECLVARYISLFARFVNISEGRRREAERVSRSRNKLVVRKEEEEAWCW